MSVTINRKELDELAKPRKVRLDPTQHLVLEKLVNDLIYEEDLEAAQVKGVFRVLDLAIRLKAEEWEGDLAIVKCTLEVTR